MVMDTVVGGFTCSHIYIVLYGDYTAIRRVLYRISGPPPLAHSASRYSRVIHPSIPPFIHSSIPPSIHPSTRPSHPSIPSIHPFAPRMCCRCGLHRSHQIGPACRLTYLALPKYTRNPSHPVPIPPKLAHIPSFALPFPQTGRGIDEQTHH